MEWHWMVSPKGTRKVDTIVTCRDGALWVEGASSLRRWKDGEWLAEASGLPNRVGGESQE